MIFGHYRKHILFLKEKLNNLDPNDDCFDNLIDLQVNIVKRILHTEKIIFSKKSEIKELKRDLRTKRNSKVTSNILKKKISKIEGRVNDYKLLLYIWRCFGDGIAFKYISKWNLKRLMYENDSPDVKQSSGFIGGKEGFARELSLVLEAKNNNVPAMLTDITNTIRHGDVCLLGGSDPYIIEVKSSKNRNKRVEKQIASLKNIHEYLENDVGNIGGREGMKRVSLEYDEAHFNGTINKAIETALLGQDCRLSPERGVYYIVKNLSNKVNYDELFTGISEPIIYMLNQSKNEQWWANYYPFTLSLKTPESLYAFLKGNIYIIVVIDALVIKEMSKNIGYDVDIVLDGETGLVFYKEIEGSDEPLYMIASDHYFSRVSHEFLSLKWFFKSQVKFLKDLENELLNGDKKGMEEF